MLHWYWLAKDLINQERSDRSHGDARACGFSAFHGPKETSGISWEIQKRFLLLGAIEAVPLFSGCGFGTFLEPYVPYWESATGGLALTALLCWFLRHHTPPTIIHAVLQREKNPPAPEILSSS